MELYQFLSTLPVRGATRRRAVCPTFYDISIHAPREGSDPATPPGWALMGTFLSTLPVRGATSMVLVTSFMGGFLSTLPVRGATRRYATENKEP